MLNIKRLIKGDEKKYDYKKKADITKRNQINKIKTEINESKKKQTELDQEIKVLKKEKNRC